uniref:Fibronectin type-III domain-containing protein n=1 Tax=Schistocephalus solidus TaxID=70667 RepID=A0A0V0J3F7_SCHSO
MHSILCLLTLIHMVLTCSSGKKPLSAGDITDLQAVVMPNGYLNVTWHGEEPERNQKKIFKIKMTPPAGYWFFCFTEFYTFDDLDLSTNYTIEVNSMDVDGGTFGSGQNISIRMQN